MAYVLEAQRLREERAERWVQRGEQGEISWGFVGPATGLAAQQ